MKNINMNQLIITINLVLLLNACGGGSSAVSSSSSNSIIIVPCGGIDYLGKENATVIEPGKKIEKLSDIADIKIWHYPNSEKLACMIEGEAKIVDIN